VAGFVLATYALMFKEPFSHIYRARGRAGRIKRLRRKHVYNMFNSGILRVTDKRTELFKKTVPFKAWRKGG
jgi:hypothetical protein